MMFCLNICLCMMCMPGTHGVDRMALDPLGLEFYLVVSLPWRLQELNLHSLEEQQVLLTEDLILSPLPAF